MPWEEKHTAGINALHEELVEALTGALSHQDCNYALQRAGWPTGAKSRHDTPVEAVRRQMSRTATIQVLKKLMEDQTERVMKNEPS